MCSLLDHVHVTSYMAILLNEWMHLLWLISMCCYGYHAQLPGRVFPFQPNTEDMFASSHAIPEWSCRLLSVQTP